MTTSTSDTKWYARSVARRRGLIALLVAAVAGGAVACSSELDPGEAPLLTIEECHEVGGTPLFDPADERPRASSCPEGLGFLGVFDEPFFGSDGGICCGGWDAPEPAEAVASAAPDAGAAPEEGGAEPEEALESGAPSEP